MTTTALTPDQQEIVAIGASVGAGCHPCFNHHIKAGRDAGITVDRLPAVLANAERIASESVSKMSGHVRAQLAFTSARPTGSPLDDALAGLGAAVGANDRMNIERFLQVAASVGASRDQLTQALGVANSTKSSAAALHERAGAKALRDLFPSEETAGGTSVEAGEPGGCGCHDADDSTDELNADEVVPA